MRLGTTLFFSFTPHSETSRSHVPTSLVIFRFRRIQIPTKELRWKVSLS
jgi:hypothetical protein